MLSAYPLERLTGPTCPGRPTMEMILTMQTVQIVKTVLISVQTMICSIEVLFQHVPARPADLTYLPDITIGTGQFCNSCDVFIFMTGSWSLSTEHIDEF